MKKILFIAYQFPPLNVGGSLRPARFVKYLPEFGIDPIVVTLHPNDYNKVYTSPKTDNYYFSEKDQPEQLYIPTENILNKTKNKLSAFISIYFNRYRGSEGKYWRKNYHAIINEYIGQNPIDAIVVTAPPFSMIPLALETSKKHGIPLIIDMRDPWSMWNMTPYSNYLNFLLTVHKERKAFKHARKIIATSEVTIADFKKLHPSVPDGKYVYIPNGYESEIDFKDIVYTPKENITIGYVGSFYYSPEAREQIMTPWWKKSGHRKLQYIPREEDWLYRSPYFFFKSMNQLFIDHPELKNMIKIQFAGKKENWFDEMVAEFNLEENVSHIGWLSQQESIQFQRQCDYLLLTSSKIKNAKDYSIAGKTFEYFELQKPILAFVAEGAQKTILENSGISLQLPIDNPINASKMLYILFTEKTVLVPNDQFINSFQIKQLTSNFASIINKSTIEI